MEKSTKLQKILEQKYTLDEQLNAELDTRMLQVGHIAQTHDIIHWSNSTLAKAF